MALWLGPRSRRQAVNAMNGALSFGSAVPAKAAS
jgi:hypothetical protein